VGLFSSLLGLEPKDGTMKLLAIIATSVGLLVSAPSATAHDIPFKFYASSLSMAFRLQVSFQNTQGVAEAQAWCRGVGFSIPHVFGGRFRGYRHFNCRAEVTYNDGEVGRYRYFGHRLASYRRSQWIYIGRWFR
jgi:hypothetical protein